MADQTVQQIQDQQQIVQAQARLREIEIRRHERRFDRDYERLHEEPRPPRVWHWLPWAAAPVTLVTVASAVMAALRTGPTFAAAAAMSLGETEIATVLSVVEGGAAVLSVDVAVITLGFLRLYLKAREQERHSADGDDPAVLSSRRPMLAALVIAFVTQIAAQFYALKDLPELALPDWAGGLIAVLMAVSAAVLAYVSGEVLAVLVWNARGDREKLYDAYRDEKSKYDQGRRAAWTRYQKRHGLFANVRANAANASEPPPGANGSQKRSRKLKPSHRKVLAWVAANPGEAENMTRQALADAAGVSSKGTASEAMSMLAKDPDLLEQVNGNS